MMRRFALALIVALGALPAPALAASPLPAVPMSQGAISPAQAVETALSRDGVEVLVQGEALGEPLSAPKGRRWVNVLGDGVAIGVVVSAADAQSIEHFGEYRQRGATLLVKGTLNSACDEHGGDLDLHASSVRVIDRGDTAPHAIHANKFYMASIVLAIALGLFWQYRRLRRRTYL